MPLGRLYHAVRPSLDASGKTVAWAAGYSPFHGPHDLVAADGDPRSTLGSCVSLWLPTGGLPDVIRVASVLSYPFGAVTSRSARWRPGGCCCGTRWRASLGAAAESRRHAVPGGLPPGGQPREGAGGGVGRGERRAAGSACGGGLAGRPFLPDGGLAVVSGEGGRLWAASGIWPAAGACGVPTPGPTRGGRFRVYRRRRRGRVRRGRVVRPLPVQAGRQGLIQEEFVPPTSFNVNLCRTAAAGGRDRRTPRRLGGVHRAEYPVARRLRGGVVGRRALLPGGRLGLVFLKRRSAPRPPARRQRRTPRHAAAAEEAGATGGLAIYPLVAWARPPLECDVPTHRRRVGGCTPSTARRLSYTRTGRSFLRRIAARPCLTRWRSL